jgi:putative transposase
MIRPAKDNATTRKTRGQMPALLQDDEAIRQLLPTTVQAALEAGMDAASGAGKGERSDARRGCRSGHHRRRLATRVGTLGLRVPQDREGLFSTGVFARWQAKHARLCLRVEVRPRGNLRVLS